MEKIPFRKYIAQERMRRGLNQREFAQKVGMSQLGISKIESGANSSISPKTVRKIITFLKENPPLVPDEVSL